MTETTNNATIISTDVTRIIVPVLQGNLFNDTAGIDTEASTRRYAEMVEDRVQAAFPNADIDVRVQWNTEGCCDDPSVFIGDDWDENLAQDVARIEAGVWEGFEWVVYETTEEVAG